MRLSPRLVAACAILAASPAVADLSDIFGLTFISNAASTEQNGESDTGPSFSMPFVISALGSLDETHSSSASIPTTDVLSNSQATATFTSDMQSLMIAHDASAFVSLDARNGGTHSEISSRVATTAQFTTDEAVRLTLTGDASIANNLRSLISPVAAPTTLALFSDADPKNPLIFEENIDTDFAYNIILQPGSYELRSSADASIATFGFPQGLYTLGSSINFTALIEPVPAPGTAGFLLISASLGTLRRKRS